MFSLSSNFCVIYNLLNKNKKKVFIYYSRFSPCSITLSLVNCISMLWMYTSFLYIPLSQMRAKAMFFILNQECFYQYAYAPTYILFFLITRINIHLSFLLISLALLNHYYIYIILYYFWRSKHYRYMLFKYDIENLTIHFSFLSHSIVVTVYNLMFVLELMFNYLWTSFKSD